MLTRKQINTLILLNHLSEYNAKFISTLYTLIHKKNPVGEREKMLDTINKVHEAVKRGKVDEEILKTGLMKIDWHIEILWYLSSCGLIDISDYLNKECFSEEFVSNAVHDLIKLIFCSQSTYNKELCTEMVKNLSKRIDSSLVKAFTKAFYKHLNEMDVPSDLMLLLGENLAMEIVYHSFTDRGMHPRDATSIVGSFKPGDDSVGNFIKRAVDFSQEDSSTRLLTFFTHCTNDSKINWNNMITMTMTMLNKDPEAMKRVWNGLIDFSLKNQSSWHLYVALLLAKFSCRTGSYLQWYTANLSSDSYRPIDTPEKGSFFLKAMTEILQFDPPCYTRIHIHKVASVPAACQSELSEYLQMAKAHLQSMGESTELAFFEGASSDLQALIDEYREKKKLPQSFLSSLNFRRAYFERELLPKLLSACEGPKSDHHAVLKTLASLGKISTSIFARHNEKCQKK